MYIHLIVAPINQTSHQTLEYLIQNLFLALIEVCAQAELVRYLHGHLPEKFQLAHYLHSAGHF